MAEKRIELFFQEQPSDKVYNVEITKTSKGYTVHVEWGRRGASLSTGTKAVDVSLKDAEKAFDKVVKQKLRKGYEEKTSKNKPAAVAPAQGQGSASKAGVFARARVGDAAQLLNPLDADLLDDFFADRRFLAQQKLDGKRLIVHVQDKGVLAVNRRGQKTSAPKAIADAARRVAPVGSVLDGELVQGPLVYWLFDLLQLGDDDLRKKSYRVRHQRLCTLDVAMQKHLDIVQSARDEKAKRALYQKLHKQNAEGIVFKRTNAPYVSGRPASGGPQLKHKFVKTADVFLTENAGNAYRMATMNGKKAKTVGKVFAGTTSSSRKKIDALLSAGETPVAEVKYLYATKDKKLYQPVFVRLRDDKAPEDCSIDQLVFTDKSVADL